MTAYVVLLGRLSDYTNARGDGDYDDKAHQCFKEQLGGQSLQILMQGWESLLFQLFRQCGH